MKKFLVCMLVLFSVFCLYGCESDNVDNTDDGINVKSVEERMNEVIRDNNYIIVDVRTKEEYNEGHIVGAINIPYDEINGNCDLDINKTIMVYCKSGKRSSVAYEAFKKLGYDVLDLGAYDSIELEKE